MKKIKFYFELKLAELYWWLVSHPKLYTIALLMKYRNKSCLNLVKVNGEKAGFNVKIKRKNNPDERLMRLRVTTFERYSAAHSDSIYKVLEEPTIRQVYIPAYYQISEPKTCEYTSPAIYIAEIRNVKIVGGNSYIIKDNKMIYDIASEKRTTIDLVGPTIRGMNGGLVTAVVMDSDNVIDTGIFMMGLASSNYYHVTIEILSRLAYVDQFEKYRKLPLIVDEVMLSVKQYHALLDKINVYHHPIIMVMDRTIYRVNYLVFPSYNTWMPINTKKNILCPEYFTIASSAIQNIRACINPEIPEMLQRKIYISRKNMKNARLVNESETRELFEKYGFETIFPEEHSFEEQVKIFSEAKYVAGTSGAALTNLVYCSPGATVICILPKEIEFYSFSTVAGMAGAQNVYLNAEIMEKTRYISTCSYKLNMHYAEGFLKQLK